MEWNTWSMRSNFRSLQGCNCGRSRKIRNDPFFLKEANYIFFYGVSCCEHLPSFQFPVVSSEQTSDTAGNKWVDMPVKFDTHVSTKLGMPKFPSWSLVKIGSASLYNPTSGLDPHEGFVRGSSFLLPWEISLYGEHEKNRRLSVSGDKRRRDTLTSKREDGKEVSDAGVAPDSYLDSHLSIFHELPTESPCGLSAFNFGKSSKEAKFKEAPNRRKLSLCVRLYRI